MEMFEGLFKDKIPVCEYYVWAYEWMVNLQQSFLKT